MYDTIENIYKMYIVLNDLLDSFTILIFRVILTIFLWIFEDIFKNSFAWLFLTVNISPYTSICSLYNIYTDCNMIIYLYYIHILQYITQLWAICYYITPLRIISYDDICAYMHYIHFINVIVHVFMMSSWCHHDVIIVSLSSAYLFEAWI